MTDLKKEKIESKISDNKSAEDLKKQLESPDKLSFGDLRYVIKASAKAMAKKEFLDAPEQRHMDAVVKMYQYIKKMDPDFAHKLLTITLKANKLKDEFGPDLFTIFEKVWDKELIFFMKEDINNAMDSILETKDLNHEEYRKEHFAIMKRYLDEKISLLKKDPRIISAFAGKEALLDKALDFNMAALLYFNELTSETISQI